VCTLFTALEKPGKLAAFSPILRGHPVNSHSQSTTTILADSVFTFYRAMLCSRGTSHGPVSVRPSQVGVLLKRLNMGSHK